MRIARTFAIWARPALAAAVSCASFPPPVEEEPAYIPAPAPPPPKPRVLRKTETIRDVVQDRRVVVAGAGRWQIREGDLEITVTAWDLLGSSAFPLPDRPGPNPTYSVVLLRLQIHNRSHQIWSPAGSIVELHTGAGHIWETRDLRGLVAAAWNGTASRSWLARADTALAKATPTAWPPEVRILPEHASPAWLLAFPVSEGDLLATALVIHGLPVEMDAAGGVRRRASPIRVPLDLRYADRSERFEQEVALVGEPEVHVTCEGPLAEWLHHALQPVHRRALTQCFMRHKVEPPVGFTFKVSVTPWGRFMGEPTESGPLAPCAHGIRGIATRPAQAGEATCQVRYEVRWQPVEDAQP